MPLSFWVCALITLVSSLVSAGYAIGGLRAADASAKMPSAYALSRSAALVAVAVTALVLSDVAFLAAVAVAMILVQAFDAIVGARAGDRLKTIGPAVTAAANAAALIWVLTA